MYCQSSFDLLTSSEKKNLKVIPWVLDFFSIVSSLYSTGRIYCKNSGIISYGMKKNAYEEQQHSFEINTG